ncbi:MAG: AAA family ATPase [Bryobacterales bacterium]|nr:AAA family ATPase [Bryobacterales bacterium]MDE0625528.1 AAA family ATPase [Bryobacterales bacterium]
MVDSTLEPRFSAICGHTEGDLDSVFDPELEGFDRNQIRDWYVGYCWR